MDIDQTRALSFGKQAEAFDRFRPDYPDEAVQWVLDRTLGKDALEVGGGTGKLTRKFVAAGLAVTVVEPDPAMADVGSCRVPEAQWEVGDPFETWDAKGRSFDLIYAGQSWHWVPEASDEKARQILKDGGGLAIIFNNPTFPESLTSLYQRHIPELLEMERTRDSHSRGDFETRLSRYFEVDVMTHAWQHHYSAGEYAGLLSTHSEKILLPPRVRDDFLGDVKAVIGDDGIDIALETVVVLGSKR